MQPPHGAHRPPGQVRFASVLCNSSSHSMISRTRDHSWPWDGEESPVQTLSHRKNRCKHPSLACTSVVALLYSQHDISCLRGSSRQALSLPSFFFPSVRIRLLIFLRIGGNRNLINSNRRGTPDRVRCLMAQDNPTWTECRFTGRTEQAAAAREKGTGIRASKTKRSISIR